MVKQAGFVHLKVNNLLTMEFPAIFVVNCQIRFWSINFFHFLGIIPSRFITNIVPDGRFSAANISKDTQVIMMDEWTSDSLSCEDAKRILQGILCSP